MTGIIICNPHGHRLQRPAQGRHGEHLTHIVNAAAKGLGPSSKYHIVGQQMAVLFHHGTTTRGIDHHPYGPNSLERGNIVFGQPLRRFELAGVRM
jgi:hypothetical protein